MRRIGIFIAILLISTGRPALAGPQPRERADAPAGSRQVSAASSVIRIAASKDGFSFTETGEILVKNADSPDIVRLPNNDLLAVFRCQPQPGAAPMLAAVRSVDDGRSWSSLRPLVLKGGGDSGNIRNPSLALMPSGMVRLYFSLTASQDGAARLGSAVTRDGVTYQTDPQVRVRCEKADAIDPLAFWAGRDLRLLAISTEATSRRTSSRPPAIWVFSSADGRHFKAAGLMREPVTPADVLGERDGYRMYVCDRGLIRCMISPDGTRWRLHPATCLRGGSDPAVVQLRDNSYLMLYCTPMDERLARQPEKVLASAGSSGDQQAAVVQQADHGLAGDQSTGNAAHDPSQQGPSEAAPWEAFTEADAAAEVGSDTAGSADSAEVSTADMSDGFPPAPDFQKPVNYLNWYKDNSLPADGENAWESYADVFTAQREGPEWKAMDVLDKGGFKFSEPWDPAAHPDWDTALQAADGLLGEFREAAQDGRPYGTPLLFMEDGKYVERPDGPGLLFEILLPHCSASRYMTKATLADAWRLENGQLNGEKIKDAWSTVLGNVEHLRQGASTIEKLVSVAERGLVEDDARSALAKGVFKSADEIEAALQALQEHDLPDPDPASYMRFECAAMLDAIQYAFSPTGDGSAITSDPEKAKQISDFLGRGQSKDDIIKQAEAIDAKIVSEAVDLLNTHFREGSDLMSKGYPELRAADYEAKEAQRAQSNPIAGVFLPSLSRVRVLQTRSEASRRATQLSYGVQLFRARNGRWPASLDELPAEHRDSVRTDPFTGDDLRYRVDGNGFTIYSAAENGTDDGGIHNPDQRKLKDSSSDDYVFWPPQ